ncbi:MAG: 50S ribosomal protein L5 [Candidatus Nanoarchaeia archaeon]|nr:50S ribosomal protein L5 [Candidatus Nanoarchaeia archaeon]MDD5587724.1 50S ribosomal protein L5 [Candidatus Nanoarchaeia archaeon]
MKDNLMRNIKIEKVTINIGVGEPGEKLEKAIKLLNYITKGKPVRTKTQKRIPDWGLRPNLEVACKVTIRGKKAVELLKNLLKAIDNKVSERKFDKEGNFGFGISEYIDIPGVDYKPDIGMSGLEVSVTLIRAGFRIKKRKIQSRKVPASHRITKEEAIKFMEKEFGLVTGGEK